MDSRTSRATESESVIRITHLVKFVKRHTGKVSGLDERGWAESESDVRITQLSRLVTQHAGKSLTPVTHRLDEVACGAGVSPASGQHTDMRRV